MTAAQRTILHVEAATTNGGSVRALENYLRYSSPGRFRNLVYLYNPLAAASRLTTLSDGLWVAPTPRSARGGLASRVAQRAKPVLAAVALARLMRQEHVDLVRLNNAPMVHTPAVLAAILTRRPLVAWLRSLPYEKPCGLKGRWLMSRMRTCVAVSSSVQRAFQATGLPIHTLRTLYDGTIIPAATAQSLNEPNRTELRIGCLGRIVPWKGLAEVLHAVAFARQRACDIRLHIMGPDEPGDQGFRQALLEMASGLGIRNLVSILPPVDDPAAFLDSLDLFVNASFPAEPFGLSLIEAMAHGLPAVAPCAGGPAEIIEHRVSGLLVAPGDVSALGEALVELVKNPTLRQELGRGARARVLRHFDVRERTTEQETYFYKLLDRGGELQRTDLPEAIETARLSGARRPTAAVECTTPTSE